MTEQAKHVEIVIKHNKYVRYEACRICSTDQQLTVGPCLFEDGTWRVVCEKCGREHAPGLTAMLIAQEGQKAYWAAQLQQARSREREADASGLADLETQLHALQKQMAATQAHIESLRKSTE